MTAQAQKTLNHTSPTSQYQYAVLAQLRRLSWRGITPDSHTFEDLLDTAGPGREYVCVDSVRLLDLADCLCIDRGSLTHEDIDGSNEKERSKQRPKQRR